MHLRCIHARWDMTEIKKIAYSSLEISNIGREQTYQLSHIHVFLSTITQLGISSQMSRKFTIRPHILQLRTHGYISMPIYG